MTNERLAELIPHIESALEDGYPLQLKGDDLRFLLEAIKARLSHEPSEVLPNRDAEIADALWKFAAFLKRTVADPEHNVWLGWTELAAARLETLAAAAKSEGS